MRPNLSVLVVASLLGSRVVAQDPIASPSPSPSSSAIQNLETTLRKLDGALAEGAARGEPLAQTLLGMRLEGTGQPADAARLYRLAAEQGFAGAQGSLGSLYLRGEGVPKDFVEANKWSLAAAKQGDPLGQLSLAVLYVTASGRPRDDIEAAAWARKAAEQDCKAAGRLPFICALARGLLGAGYLDGRGVPQDYVLAYMWANLAAAELSVEQGKHSVIVRDDAAKRMTPDQIAEAQRLTREWKPLAPTSK